MYRLTKVCCPHIPNPDLMSPSGYLPAGLLLASMLAAPGLAAANRSDPWADARNLNFTAAGAGIAPLHQAAPDDARLAVAYAAALLARQPRTEANIIEARALLERTAQFTPTAPSPADTDQRILAAYLVARIDHDHFENPRLDIARSGYEALRVAHPGHPLADQAALQLGYMLAYQTAGLSPADTIAPVEALLASVHSENARRELHLLLARIQVRTLHNDAAALAHFQAARAIGCQATNRDNELDLTIGMLAARLGQGDLAARHYLAFAKANPQEVRTQTVRRLAAEALAASGSSTK
ncbi:hypothetical protein IMCC26134_03665 [Verrucomicrobia bacterium IMCC26134]|nr:hypothetical protein IMCC26134_03665 [Verrucomicrobia bacterium IMCC26134]